MLHDPERKCITVEEYAPTQFLHMGATGLSPDAFLFHGIAL